MYGREEDIKYLSQCLKRRDQFSNLGVDWRIIFKLILCVKILTGFWIGTNG
jgi:hypothetical protein